MSNKTRFTPIRISIFTVLGLSVAACSDSATPSSLDQPDSGDSGDSGDASDAATASDAETTDDADVVNDGGATEALCKDAVEIVIEGQRTGFVRCSDGTRHRVEAIELPPPYVGASDCKGTERYRYCSTDADCTYGLYGRCRSGIHYGTPGPDEPFYETPRQCSCVYSCASDADCSSGEVCVPGGVVPGRHRPFCAPATCKTGDDCASGECGLSVQEDDGCFKQDIRLGCRSTADTCRLDADCNGYSEQCIHLGSRFQCSGPTCAIGRPLLIEGRARTAVARSRGDWAAHELLPDVAALAPELRERLAQHWLDIAAMEHASVASFARFSLQLLALGAPPDLLADAQQAALDEVEHARIAYGVASAYAGRKLGPGALDPTGIDLVTNRTEVIRALVFEACVNETLGVAEALAMADSVSDPTLSAIHRRIAQDEQRHAELAWRTLAWLLDGAAPEEVEEAELAFAEAIQAAKRDPNDARDPSPEHGLFEAKALGSLRRHALAQVVEPCASALFGRLKMAA